MAGRLRRRFLTRLARYFRRAEADWLLLAGRLLDLEAMTRSAASSTKYFTVGLAAADLAQSFSLRAVFPIPGRLAMAAPSIPPAIAPTVVPRTIIRVEPCPRLELPEELSE